MKKNDILLVGFFSKNESPYIDIYRDVLTKVGVTNDVLYFERYGTKADELDGEIVFNEYCPTGGHKIKKAGTMWRYASFLRGVIKKNQYKGIIVFATVPAIMTADILLKDFKGKYILDIRDYTHEFNKLYYAIEKKLVENAYATVISSRGFKKFLPESVDYIISHNVPQIIDQGNNEIDDPKEDSDKCVIGFVGSIRYYAENCKLIDCFKSKKHYSLEYYGTTTAGCDLESYCNKEGITNVSFMGKFNNKDKPKIYENIDIINSIYGIDRYETIIALPNRLYDACIYRKPIIVSKGTYLSEVVNKYNLGIAVDVFNDDVALLIDEYMKRYDSEEFTKNCDRLIARARQDMELQEKVICNFANHLKELSI